MKAGIRIRDPNTGVVRLDVSDFTVRVVHSEFVVINGNGSRQVAGVTPDNAGAYLIPGFQAGWPVYTGSGWGVLAARLPKMPIVTVGQGIVNWTLGAGEAPGQMWQILVVRYK